VAYSFLPDVIRGKHDAIDRQLAELNVSRPLTDLFADGVRDSQSLPR